MVVGPSRGANLEFVDLSGADFRGADLRGARLRGARLSGADLRGADLTGADLRGVLAMWSGIKADDSKLDHCDVRDADLSGIEAPGMSLHAANLEGSRWDGANLRDATLTSCRVGWRSIWLTESGSGQSVGASAWFNHATLSGANLSGANLPGVSMYRADARGAIAREAILTGANLVRADFRDADMDGADLCEADLREVSVVGASMRYASLVGANLIATRFDHVDVKGLRLGASVLLGCQSTSLPDRDFVVNLAPNLSASVGSTDMGLTCLVVAEYVDASIRDQLTGILRQHGVVAYVATPAEVASVAGPVTVARAFDAHPLTIVVTDAETSVSWMAVLRRSLIQSPPWVDRALVHITTQAPGLPARFEIAGAPSAHLATTIAALRGSFADAEPTNERFTHA